MAYGESNGHVTPKGQVVTLNTLRVQYRENSCMEMLFSNNG